MCREKHVVLSVWLQSDLLDLLWSECLAKYPVKSVGVDGARASDSDITVASRERPDQVRKEILPTCFWRHCWKKRILSE